MALQSLFSPLLVSTTHISSLHTPNHTSIISPFRSIRCVAKTETTADHTITRRSANYKKSAWDYDFVQSLTSDYTDEKYLKQAEKLKHEVKCLINRVMDPLEKLELLDAIQRLGLKYQFETEIKKALHIVYEDGNSAMSSDDLHAIALRFRLLRQHGYHVTQDVFESLRDKTNKLKASICEDVKGLLSLYEASFYGLEGETIMDEAKAFATTQLKDIKGTISSPSLARKVDHALDMPLHWRLTRVEARWFIDTYEQQLDKNPTLLQLAKLDYNIVQSVHRKEVVKLASWWVDMGLNNISFARDRLVEHYFWCNGFVCEPEYVPFRSMATKIISLITTIDDVYDVYGSLEELELFTDIVERWNLDGIDKLPDNIKTCLLAMYNTSNEIGYWTIKERGFNIIPYLSKQWADLCKAYLKEAKWYHGGYKPKLEDYLDNAVVSIAGPLMLFSSYFLTTNKITEEALDYIYKLPSIVHCGCMLIRLSNDLGTSSDELARGDIPKSVQCYMNETGATEEVAREYIKSLVDETWKTLNKDIHKSYPFSEPFLSAIPNGGRTAQCLYQHGDGHGAPGNRTKDHLISLLFQPIPLN